MEFVELFSSIGAFFATVEITIPLSQLLLLLVLSTLSLLFSKVKLALLINYIFTVYWGYFLNRDLAIEMMGESNTVAYVYFGFGISIIILAMVGFISREE
jgi:hypothetical protein